ncbi:MAG: chromosome segregation protein SMC [Desulfobacterales bacterium]|nr:MAG: chromosome segregation protein SMC [Desulfobacterales bacterium]
MKLKKLEIIGFKSFCDKSIIEFPPGISAVVGPNGCGKSNIIDALRWVMGEQSVKQLRGKSMEDVIFSGANGKQPLNMAEVSLILSNENGDAPEELKDFTEIMLTRRLYRSGESAYFLNKQPCRLKDIHSIFLGSGLGSRSYAVIQQGNIGAITEAGPEERRLFIEEAAGVTRYKSRKYEALRKIETTNQNLLRVSDILLEIKRQMNSLKRQARKAEIYNNFQKRIRVLDIRLGLHYYDDYTRQIEKTDALLNELKDADIGHTSELKKLDAAVEKIKLNRQQKIQEISEQKAQKFETQRNIDRIENDLAHQGNDIERLSQESSDLQATFENLEQKNVEMVSEISNVENDNARIIEEISLVRDHLENERLADQKISGQFTQLNQELDSHKTQLMDLVAQEAQYKNIYQNAANNKESLQRRLKNAEEEEALAQKRIAEIQKKEAEIKSHLSSTKQEIADLDHRITTIREQLKEKTKVLSRQVELAQTLELERNTIRSNLNTLQKMEDNFEWYKDGVRAIMQARHAMLETQTTEEKGENGASPAINQALSDNILGLMADIIEAKPSFETAVEAALGESLQYIVVKDQETGRKAIDYLQSQKAGRSGFIPISSIKQFDEDPPQIPDPSQQLLHHVKVKPGFEKMAQTFLGHVVFARDLKEAIKLFNRNGVLQTIVTQNGDLISPQGIMIGGSKDRLNGILAKKQELKDLHHQSKECDQKLEKARGEQTKLDSDVRELENQLQKLIEQKNKVTQNEIETEKTLYMVTEDLKNARRHLEIVSLEQEQLLGESSDIDAEISKYNRALTNLSAEISTLQQKVKQITENISTVSGEMEDLNQKVVDLKLKLTALNAKLENNNTSLRRLRDFYADGQKRLEQLTREIHLKHEKEKIAKQKIEDYEQMLSEMYRKMEHLDQALQDNETDYLVIDSKLKDSDGLISNIQSKREKKSEKFRLLELELSQHQIKRDNVANRLEERYQSPFSILKTEFHENIQDDEISPEMAIDEMEAELSRCKEKIAKILDVNLGAIREYEELKDRYEFLKAQRDDLVQAIEDLHKVIHKINKITQERFMETFNLINTKLREVFPRLFEGGSAKLILTEPTKPLETGVELMIHLPGKKLTRLSLLSGGEKALSAIAFIFSIFLIKPASFCLLDEIDAPLDDANIFRFNDLLKIIGDKSQIIMITHNKRTMEFADTLFGITMAEKGISKMISVRFDRSAQAN